MVAQTLRMFCCVTLMTSMAFAQYGGLGYGGGNSSGQGVNAGGTNVKSPSDKLTTALETTVKLDFNGNPLVEIVIFLSEIHKLPVIIDALALSEEDISPDEEVTITNEDIPLHQALDLLLNPLKLTYIGEGDVLKITTQSVADETFELRNYDVSDILNGQTDESSLISMIHATTHVEWMDTAGNGGHAEVLNGLLIISHTQQTHRKISDILALYRKSQAEQLADASTRTSVVTYGVIQNHQPTTSGMAIAPGAGSGESALPKDEGVELAEKLAEIIPTLIAPDSWETAEIHAVGGAIIIKQTGDVHFQIKQMLNPYMQPRVAMNMGGYGGGMAQPPMGGFYNVNDLPN